ncbi:MAG: co-chaperone GroES, partial [Proteobacteria bacterium]|nr:co-chaperone GroES [Pseudomonadota bacterium]
HDGVLVKRVDPEIKTTSGLYLPDNAQEKSAFAIVIAIGDGRELDDGKIRPPKIKVGDKVLLAKWGGTEVKVQGEEYLIVKESELLAVVQ